MLQAGKRYYCVPVEGLDTLSHQEMARCVQTCDS